MKNNISFARHAFIDSEYDSYVTLRVEYALTGALRDLVGIGMYGMFHQPGLKVSRAEHEHLTLTQY
jgi:hypothetical protein